MIDLNLKKQENQNKFDKSYFSIKNMNFSYKNKTGNLGALFFNYLFDEWFYQKVKKKNYFNHKKMTKFENQVIFCILKYKKF